MNQLLRTASVGLLAALAAVSLAACGGGQAGGSPSGSSKGSNTGSSACGGTAAKYAALKGKNITVGTSPGPSNYDAPDPNDPSKVIGIEPDIMAAVSKCLGFSYTFQKLDFNGLIPALQAKHIQAITSGMYASDERAKQISFVQYMKAGEASLVAKGNPKNIKSLDDTCGLIAAEAVGTVENAIFDKQSAACKVKGKPAIKALSLQGNDQAKEALANGRADVFLTDAGVASYLAKKDPKVQVGFPIPSDFVFGIGVAKDDTQLLNGINDVLGYLAKSGQLKQLMAKWGFSESQSFTPSIKS